MPVQAYLLQYFYETILPTCFYMLNTVLVNEGSPPYNLWHFTNTFCIMHTSILLVLRFYNSNKNLRCSTCPDTIPQVLALI